MRRCRIGPLAVVFSGYYAIFVFLAVLAVRAIYLTANNRGLMSQRCLIIGANGEARKAIDLVEQHPHSGIRILGLIYCGPDKDKIGKFVDDYPILGGLDSVEKFVQLYDIERLIIAATQEAEPALLRRLRSFRYRGLALVDFVSLYEELAQEIPLDHINDEWLFLASMNNSRIHIRRLKRLTDMFVAMIGLIVILAGHAGDCLGDPADLQRAGVVPAGAPGAGQPAVYADEVPHDESRCRERNGAGVGRGR